METILNFVLNELIKLNINNKHQAMNHHCHTDDGSIADAIAKLKDLFEKFVATGVKTAVVTNHGTMMSSPKIRALADKYGIKISYGFEAYVRFKETGEVLCHLIVLAKNLRGYKKVARLCSKGERRKAVEGGNFSINIEEDLKDLAPDVIITTACENGPLGRVLLSDEKVLRDIDKIISKNNSLRKEFETLGGVKTIDDYEASANCVKEMKKSLTQLKKESKKDSSLEEKVIELSLKIENMNEALASSKDLYKRVLKIRDDIASNEEKIENLENELKGDDEKVALAEKILVRLKNLFHDDLYVEVQNHGREQERRVFTTAVELAKKHGVKLTVANDAHMVNGDAKDIETLQIIRAFRWNEMHDVDESSKRLYCLTLEEQVSALLEILSPEDVIEAFKGNREIENKLEDVRLSDEKHYPKYKGCLKGETAEGAMIRLIQEGQKRLFPNGEGWTEEYKSRANMEFKVMKTMGVIDYLLIVADFIEYGNLLGHLPKALIKNAPFEKGALKEYIKKYGKKTGYAMGCGRGSAVGSLICYLLGITKLDPIPLGLKFERFLNIDRVSMPDIDSDFSPEVRDKCIEYVRYLYGANCVAGIATVGTFACKKAIRNYAMVRGTYNVPNGMKVEDYKRFWSKFADKLCKLIPNTPGIKIQDVYKNLEDTLSSTKEWGYYKEILDKALLIEGLPSHYGVHAAGIIITDGTEIDEIVPVMYSAKKNQFCTMCDMVDAEAEYGLLKMDFLGLKNLKYISDCIYMIEKDLGITIEPDEIPFEEEVIKGIYGKGLTGFIFQFEGEGITNMMERFKPSEFSHIIAGNAAYRPGPMQFIEKMIAVKNGLESVKYLCPELEEILSETFGCILYQEQVMDICKALAGFSMSRADNVRRFMSKKKVDKLAHEKIDFINGCVAKGIEEKVAEELFEQMMDFASYAFNKSHAAAYSRVSYITAWLKYYYPKQYLAACMNTVELEKSTVLLKDCKQLGIKLLLPHINKSELDFSVVYDEEAILFGLEKVKRVGSIAPMIVEARGDVPFKSFKDFVMRAHFKKDATESLIMAGAFDCFEKNRAALLASLPELSSLKTEIDKLNSVIKESELLKANFDVYLNGKFEEGGFKHFKKMPATIELVEKKIVDSKRKLEEAKDKFETYDISSSIVPNNEIQNLRWENEMLGVYLTGHPMDSYNAPSSYGADEIAKMTSHTKSLVGTIKNLSVSSNGNMFFTIDDGTGVQNAVIWSSILPKAFVPNAKLGENVDEKSGLILKDKGEGYVYVFSGKVKESILTRTVTNDDGDEVEEDYTERRFEVREFSSLKMVEKPFIIELGSRSEWDDIKEYIYLYKSEEDDARELKIHLAGEPEDKLNACVFKVSPTFYDIPDIYGIKIRK